MNYTRGIWAELFPDQVWPGEDAAVRALADEVRSLRLLTECIATTIVDEQQALRDPDEIQRAHDLVGQYAFEANDPVTFEHVSALCWVLRHDHNTAFAQILELVEARLRHLRIQVIRLPDVVDPRQEK
jgi:hypothetical protein